MSERRKVARNRLGLAPQCECPLCKFEQKLIFKVLTFTPVILYGLDVNDDMESEVAQEHLIGHFRRLDLDLFDILADMIDPAGNTTWRLELKRRRPGKPKRSRDFANFLRWNYEERLEELTEEQHPTPAKTALGELAAQFEIPDGQLRALIERSQGKRRRPKS
jgi:hypothetical protein